VELLEETSQGNRRHAFPLASVTNPLVRLREAIEEQNAPAWQTFRALKKSCALRLDQAGYTVFAGVRKERDAHMLRQAASSRLTPVILDVTDDRIIAEACQLIRETVGAAGLVGLVNNVGVGVTAPIELVPLEAVRRQFDINVIGQVAVIQALLPLIRAARRHIIAVGSVGGKVTIPFGGPLCASKYALESINDALRMELRPWGIHVVLVAPGSIRTPAVDKLVADSKVMLNRFSPEGRARYAASYRVVLQKLTREHEGREASLPVQLRLPFQTGWR
jgi:NAD(P)-dependent dehydrogenase (short-subunit alcohol dehydrogenase family)